MQEPDSERAPVLEMPRRSLEPAPAPLASPSSVGDMPRWQMILTFVLAALLAMAVAVAVHSERRARAIENRLEESMSEVQAGLQSLKAGVRFDSARQQLLLGIRDEILRVNDDVGLGEAYRYAELLTAATDKYPSVDPVLLLSIGIVESGYDVRARSHANARGLYQIWPSTGRMLATMLGWEYSDEMLYDPRRNTELAALYLDVLLTTYDDVPTALAEYNGGPINAGLYVAGSHKAAAETRQYVPKVLENYERLVKSLPHAPGLGPDIVYRDPERSGKRLGVAPAN